MKRRFIAAPPGLWAAVEAFAEQWENTPEVDRGVNINAAVRHLIAVGLTTEGVLAGWLSREVLDDGLARLAGESSAADERPELRWGLQPLPAAHAAWGCKTPFMGVNNLLPLPAVDRVDMWGSRAARNRLRHLLDARLTWRELEAQVAQIPAAKTAVVYEDADVTVEARVSLDTAHVTVSMLTPVPWQGRRR